MAMPFLEFESPIQSILCCPFHGDSTDWMQESDYFIASFSLGVTEQFHVESCLLFPLYYSEGIALNCLKITCVGTL